MMSPKRTVFTVLNKTLMCFLILSISLLNAITASQDPKPSPPILTQPSDPQNCKAALVMEASSSDIVYEYNSHQQLAPASMVKMMLLLIAMEKVKAEILSLDDIITVSAAASKIGGSQVYLKHGETFPLRELLESVAIQSANDSCYAIAEHIAGSNLGFIELMNARALQLGMNNTTFQTPHGLPPGKNQLPDMTTAYDLALLARELVTKHPEVLEWTSMDTLPFRDGTLVMTNTNRLVRQLNGCDGLKTGYYRQAGFSVTATAMQNDVRIIAIVMGCDKGKERFEEAARLIQWGLSLFRKIDLIPAEFVIDKSIPVKDGKKQETYPVTQTPLNAVIRKTDIDNIIMKTKLEKELTAPVSPGTVCGSIHFLLNDRELGSSLLVTGETIEKLSMWGKLKRMVGL